jgi:hypothetical protein
VGVDQHYTPAIVADALLGHLNLTESSTVFDPAAGEGALLSAVSRVFPTGPKLFATDIDGRAVSALRKSDLPIEVGKCDVLDDRSRSSSPIWRGLRQTNPDVIVMNPPFSFRGRNKLVTRGTFVGRLPPALQFIAICLEEFPSSPQIGAIIPSGALNSTSNQSFWGWIRASHDVSVVVELGRKTFAGVSASASLVILERRDSGDRVSNSLKPGLTISSSRKNCGPADPCRCVEVIRGRVPVGRTGRDVSEPLAFLHTSDLRDYGLLPTSAVAPTQLGTEGGFVALPRVGAARGKVAIVRDPVVLSDCVFAVRPVDQGQLIALHGQLENVVEAGRWPARGTGAPHVNTAQLIDLLSRLGWRPTIVPASAPRFPDSSHVIP